MARDRLKEYVRLTPARQSRMGYMWSTVPVEMAAWEVEVEFSITGQPSLGGDGLAFWFVDSPENLGHVFGSMDYFFGLMVAFDTYNNDGAGDHPLVTAMLNDGSIRYDASTDGAQQSADSCSFQYRNVANHGRVQAKFTYVNDKFSVALRQSGDAEWFECIEIEDIFLGVDKYFGLTAQTGDVADNHDVYSVRTRNLGPAQPDLSEIRKSYYRHQHELHEQAQAKKHEASVLSTEDFQSQVMALLHQVLSTQQLVEMSQVAMAAMLEQSLVKPEGPSAPPPSGAAVDESVEPAAATGSASASDSKAIKAVAGDISAMAKVQKDLAAQVKQLATQVQQLAEQGVPAAAAPAAAGKGAAAGAPGGIDAASLKRVEDALASKMAELLSAVNNIGEMDADMAKSIAGVGHMVEEEKMQMTMFQKRVSLDTSHILKAIQEVNDGVAVDSDDEAGGSSTLGSIALVAVGFAISSALNWFRSRSANAVHAYKLP